MYKCYLEYIGNLELISINHICVRDSNENTPEFV